MLGFSVVCPVYDLSLGLGQLVEEPCFCDNRIRSFSMNPDRAASILVSKGLVWRDRGARPNRSYRLEIVRFLQLSLAIGPAYGDRKVPIMADFDGRVGSVDQVRMQRYPVQCIGADDFTLHLRLSRRPSDGELRLVFLTWTGFPEAVTKGRATSDRIAQPQEACMLHAVQSGAGNNLDVPSVTLGPVTSCGGQKCDSENGQRGYHPAVTSTSPHIGRCIYFSYTGSAVSFRFQRRVTRTGTFVVLQERRTGRLAAVERTWDFGVSASSCHRKRSCRAAVSAPTCSRPITIRIYDFVG